MPKEITHWTLALRSLDKLKDCPLKQSLQENLPLYLLGAVLPDSPFYALGGKDRGFYLKAAEAAHGERGEDSYIPLRKFALMKGQDMSPAELALSCGWLSHIQSDAHFHPLVYYFSGYTSGADTPAFQRSLRRHFRIETLMDIHNERQLPAHYHNKLRCIIQSSDSGLKEISRMVSELYFGVETHSQKAFSMLKQHMRLQSLFSRAGLRIMLSLIPGMRNKRALFYPVRRKAMPFFEMPLRYRHPRSGEWYEETYSELADRCTDKQAALFTWIDKQRDEGDIFPFFADIVGPGLASGQPHTYNHEMKYFDTSLSIRDLIYKYKVLSSIF